MIRSVAAVLFGSMLCLFCFLGRCESTVTLTIENDVVGHNYIAYQLFSGDVEELDGKKVLCNYRWSESVNVKEFVKIIRRNMSGPEKKKYPILLENPVKPEKVLTELMEYLCELLRGEETRYVKIISETLPNNFLGNAPYEGTWRDGKYVFKDLPSGYYVIVDKLSWPENPQSEELLEVTAQEDLFADLEHFMLIQASESITVFPKNAVPTLKKEVAVYGSGRIPYTEVQNGPDSIQWKHEEVYGIQEPIVYQLTTDVPECAQWYSDYTLKIVDVLPEGLELHDEDEIVLLWAASDNETSYFERNIVRNTGEEPVYETDIYRGEDYTKLTVTVHLRYSTFYMEFDGFGKAAEVRAVRVRYKAYLNNEAEVFPGKNQNTARMYYRNDPRTQGWGKTKDVDAIVYTGKLTVRKADPAHNLLKGAVFELSRLDNEEFEILTIIDDSDGNLDGKFEFVGIGPGVYRLRETTAPNGYNALPGDVFFQVRKNEANSGVSIQCLDKSGTLLKNLSSVQNVYMPELTLEQDGWMMEIINTAGIQLPSTGAAGTVLIYLAGGILVIYALTGFVFQRIKRLVIHS